MIDNNNNNNNNNNCIPVIFPKCPNDKDIYLKFFHGWGYIGDKDWYECPKCKGLFLR